MLTGFGMSQLRGTATWVGSFTDINHQQKKGNHSNMNAVLNTPQTERITLYYREGSSDKVYQAALETQGEGFVVNIAYGRRGSTLQTGTKTAAPMEYDSAKRTYDKLVGEKKAKGYTEGPDGSPTSIRTKRTGQLASCRSCSIPSTGRRLNGCSKIELSACRRSLMGAGC
jgi:predicted DNA-binding WGR domain protein